MTEDDPLVSRAMSRLYMRLAEVRERAGAPRAEIDRLLGRCADYTFEAVRSREMSYGHCPPGKLCDACLAQGLAMHSGTARRRGEQWLEDRRQARAVRATEADRELLEATARGKMRDVASDERLLEQLAAITLRYAVPELG